MIFNYKLWVRKSEIVETIIRMIIKIYEVAYTFLNKNWTNYRWYLDNWTKEYAYTSSHHMKILTSKKRRRLSEKMKWFTNEVYLNFLVTRRCSTFPRFPFSGQHHLRYHHNALVGRHYHSWKIGFDRSLHM